MIPYWILFLVFALGAIQAGRAPYHRFAGVGPGGEPQGPAKSTVIEALLVPAALIPLLLIGLRYKVGADWIPYIYIFDSIRHSSLADALTETDPGYAFLNWAAQGLGADVWLVNLACAALFTVGLVRFAKCQPNPWLAIVVAIPYLVIGVGMGYTRQAVAIGFAMGGLAAIHKGSFGRFAAWVLVGALFHRTAVILIPVVAISYSRNRFQTAALATIAVVLGYFILSGGIERFQRIYINQVYEAQGAGIRLAMNLPPAIIYLLTQRRFFADVIERRIWRNFAILALVSFVIWMMITSTVSIDRAALYIIPLQLVVLSRLPYVFGRQGQASGQVVALVIAYSAVVQFVWLNFANHARFWVPYHVWPLGVFGGA